MVRDSEVWMYNSRYGGFTDLEWRRVGLEDMDERAYHLDAYRRREHTYAIMKSMDLTGMVFYSVL